jgi:WD40 repeat protein
MATLSPLTLEIVERGLAGMHALSADENRLLVMSRAARDRAAATARRIQIGFLVLMAVLAVATVTAVVAYNEAEKDKQETVFSNTTDKVRSDLYTSPLSGLIVAFNAANGALKEGFELANELQMSLSEAVERARLKNSIDLGSPIAALAVHPGGHTFAAALGDGCIRFFDLSGKETKPELRCSVDDTGVERTSVRDVEYAEDGEALYAACTDGVLRKFAPLEPRTKPVRFSRKGAPSPLSPLTCVAVSGDGECVATGAENGTILVWRRNVSDPIELDLPPTGGAQEYRVNDLVFVPIATEQRSYRLAVVDDAGRLRIWNIVDGVHTPLDPINEGEGPLLCVAARAAPSTQVHIATGGQDRTVRVYLADGGRLRRPNRERTSLGPLESSHDRDDDGDDDRNERSVIIDNHMAPVVSISFDETGDTIYSGDENGIVLIHNHRGSPAARPFRGLDGSATAIVHAGSRLALIGSDDHHVRVRDSRGLQVMHDLRALDQKKVKWNDPAMRGVAINHDGTRLATTADQAHGAIWRRENFEELQLLPMESRDKLKMCDGDFSDAIFVVPGGTRDSNVDPSDDEVIASGCSNGHVHIWSRGLEPIWYEIAEAAVTCLDVDPSSQWLAVGTEDGVVGLIDLLDLDDPNHGALYLLHRSPPAAPTTAEVTDVAIGPSFKSGQAAAVLAIAFRDSVAGADDSRIEIWDDNRDGWCMRPPVAKKPGSDHFFFDHHDSHGEIYSLAMRPDGSTLFSVGEDGKIRGRDLDGDGQERFVAQKAHLGGAFAIDISTDGKRVITGGDDGRVVMWGVLDEEPADPRRENQFQFGRIAQMVPDHAGPVAAVAFGGPGDLIAMSGDETGAARVWRAHPAVWLDIAAQRLGENREVGPGKGGKPKEEVRGFISTRLWWEQLDVSEYMPPR